jgi:hypothetical protein
MNSLSTFWAAALLRLVIIPRSHQVQSDLIYQTALAWNGREGRAGECDKARLATIQQ